MHDGDQNECNRSASYIMASSSGAQIGDIARNPWIFSSCSVTEIEAIIERLNK